MTNIITKPYFDNQNSSNLDPSCYLWNGLGLKYQIQVDSGLMSDEKCAGGSAGLIVGSHLIVNNKIHNILTGHSISNDGFNLSIINKIKQTFGEDYSFGFNNYYNADLASHICANTDDDFYVVAGKYLARMVRVGSSGAYWYCDWVIRHPFYNHINATTPTITTHTTIIKCVGDYVYLFYSKIETSGTVVYSGLAMIGSSSIVGFSTGLAHENSYVAIERDIKPTLRSYSIYESNGASDSWLGRNEWRLKDVQYSTKFKASNLVYDSSGFYFVGIKDANDGPSVFRLAIDENGFPTGEVEKIYELGGFKEISAPITLGNGKIVFACYRPEEKLYSEVFKYYSGFYKSNENAIKLIAIDVNTLAVTEKIMDRTPRQIIPIRNERWVILCNGDKERINNGLLTYKKYLGNDTTYPSPGQPILGLKTDLYLLKDGNLSIISQLEKRIIETFDGVYSKYYEPVPAMSGVTAINGYYIVIPTHGTSGGTPIDSQNSASSRIFKIKINDDSTNTTSAFSMYSGSGQPQTFRSPITQSKQIVVFTPEDTVEHTLLLNSYDGFIRAYSIYDMENIAETDTESSSETSAETSSADIEDASSSSSSSSSDPDLNPQKIYGIIADQGNYNLLHFSYEVKKSTSIVELDAPDLSTGMDYSKIVTANKFSPTASTSKTITPFTEESLYPTDSEIYVDMIISNADNAKSIAAYTHTKTLNEISGQLTYFTPKFSWSITPNVIKDSEYISSVWLSSLDSKLCKVALSLKNATPVYALAMPEPCIFSRFGYQSPNCYISANNYLYAEQINHYIENKEYKITQFELNKTYNANQDVVVYQDDKAAWSVQTYNGILVKRNSETLDIEETFEGFDSPFKMLWSKYHKSYFLAGTYNLWKISEDTTSIKSIFSTESNKIIDFAISDNGKIAMILRDPTSDYIRIINNDLYKILHYSKFALYSIKHCEYCGNEKFYFLKETSVENKTYTGESIIYDNEIIESPISLKIEEQRPVVNTSVTTLNPVLILYPNGGETLVRGELLDIVWKSSKSIADRVKIELYDLVEIPIIYTIVDSAPNDGSYRWQVPNDLPFSSNYSIKITWISTSELDVNADYSDNKFVVAEEKPESILTVETVSGISYDPVENIMVIVLNNGMTAIQTLKDLKTYGFFNTNINKITSVQAINERTYDFDSISMVRIFVGSKELLNDKWDSGIIETDLLSMYYGGGNNLTPGETYYVNIQVYSAKYGWSSVQSQQFTMPN